MPKDKEKIKKILNLKEDADLAIFDELQEIKGDLKGESGQIQETITALTEEVKKKETELNIEIDPEDIRGEKGESGKDGDKGDKGEKGDVGLSGLDGVDGKDGKDGIDGAPGERGERGERGDKFKFKDFTEEERTSLRGEKGGRGRSGGFDLKVFDDGQMIGQGPIELNFQNTTVTNEGGRRVNIDVSPAESNTLNELSDVTITGTPADN